MALVAMLHHHWPNAFFKKTQPVVPKDDLPRAAAKTSNKRKQTRASNE